MGIAPSANIGDRATMFEAIHGSAPDIAGQGLANPSGMLLASLEMLRHLGHYEHAATIQNAWLATLEQGKRTGDLAEGKTALSTNEFAEAVIDNLGATPTQIAPASAAGSAVSIPPLDGQHRQAVTKELVGVDIFLDAIGAPDDIAKALQAAAGAEIPCKCSPTAGSRSGPMATRAPPAPTTGAAASNWKVKKQSQPKRWWNSWQESSTRD